MNSVLIANRGEIAVRVLRTVKELGLRGIVVHTATDREAPFVRLADAAFEIDCYTNQSVLVERAHAEGAAIHPGYGFLSENADFAAACESAGVRFIGPPSAAMRAVGDKERAKAAAIRAGVPVVRGFELNGADPSMSASVVASMEYPLLIKACAGGGGRGMRVVTEPAGLASAIEAAAREAKATFGDPRILIEKFISPARHVEVQVVADSFGSVVTFGERECSIQRRHQKLLEESPSPGVSAELRQELCDAAARLMRDAGYVGAGTVEFLVDADRKFYFLEVNARLQVEHPVTEMVWGVDLVRLQIEVAMGRPLARDFGRPVGHAIEVRICAEDPAANFLPRAGVATRLRWPHGPGIRVDAGIDEGGAVTLDYDSMLAKLIVHASDRSQAIARLKRALADTRIDGVPTNLPLFRAIVGNARFCAGALSTDFLELELCALGAMTDDAARPANRNPWAAFANGAGAGHKPVTGAHAQHGDSDSFAPEITAPMTGRVVRVAVAIGQSLARGETAIVLSAMKMEYALCAAAPCRVVAVRCREGDSVEIGDLLVVVEEAASPSEARATVEPAS